MESKLLQQGNDGEVALKNWLHHNGLSYVRISQEKTWFATLFRDDIKRPDFLVLLESVGLIAVDVKNYTPSKKSGYTLNLEKEIRRVMAFERIFRIPVWYAYLAEKEGRQVWYWISALKAVETGEVVKKAEKDEFVFIKLEHFAEIGTNDDLGKLYTQRLNGYRKIKDFKIK